MSNDSPKPQGYGHDDKGKAGGQSVPDGRVNVAHSAPISCIAGAIIRWYRTGTSAPSTSAREAIR